MGGRSSEARRRNANRFQGKKKADDSKRQFSQRVDLLFCAVSVQERDELSAQHPTGDSNRTRLVVAKKAAGPIKRRRNRRHDKIVCNEGCILCGQSRRSIKSVYQRRAMADASRFIVARVTQRIDRQCLMIAGVGLLQRLPLNHACFSTPAMQAIDP